MKKLAFGALCVGLLTIAACGGGGNDADARIITRDGADGPPGGACNILTNTGCEAGQKCTWIRVSVAPPLGQVGCTADGTVDINGSCMYGAAGAATGFDNCLGGHICLANPETDQATGTCRKICSLMDASAPCATDYACGSYYRFFSNADTDTPLAGVCDPTCDPLSGNRDYDDAPYCGGPMDGAEPGAKGCYGIPSNDATPTKFTCSGRGEGGHRMVLQMPYFLNSCDSGAVPLMYESTGSTEVICVMTCGAKDCNTTIRATDPQCYKGAAPYTTTARGCTAAAEECKFMWWFEDQATPITPDSDRVGFCVNYTKYQWDHDMDTGTDPINWTACRNSLDADPQTEINADLNWGCVNSAATPGPGKTALAPQQLPRASKLGINIRPLLSPAEIKRKFDETH